MNEIRFSFVIFRFVNITYYNISFVYEKCEIGAMCVPIYKEFLL